MFIEIVRRVSAAIIRRLLLRVLPQSGVSLSLCLFIEGESILSRISHYALISRSTLGLAALGSALVGPTASAQKLGTTQQIIAAHQMTAIKDSVPAAAARATKLGAFDLKQSLNVIVCMQFADPKAMQDYADAVSDPNSLLYGQWLTPQEIGQKFGPNQADYDAMIAHLQANGLHIDETPANRMSIRVSGTAAQMQTAFGVTLNNYKESAQDAAARGPQVQPYTFFASSTPVQIPAALDGKITSVEGLENYTRPLPRLKKFTVSGPFDAVVARNAYGLGTIYGAGLTGAGRTVGISNFDGVNPVKNAPLYITRNGLPTPAAGAGSNIQRITVSGSSGTNGGAEGDLDFQAVLGMAPLSNIIIYDSTSNLLAVLTREATDNTADILTESYGWALSSSSATSCHNQHTMMTAQGQTYLCASGDNGNIQTAQLGSDGNYHVFDYPDYDPDVTNIGGTILTANNGPGYSYFSETGWSGSGGLYSTSTASFNVLPTWQKGRNVPTTNKRLVPDIASHAAGSGNNAYYIYYGNGQFVSISGTSCSSPVDAGSLALVEQYMINQGGLPANSAGKRRLGRINDRLYAFNGRNDIYHDVTTGSSTAGSAKPYWDYVTGWGSVNWYNLAAALLSPLTVTVTPAATTLNAGQTLNLTANVTGTNVTTVTWSVVSGPGTVSSTGVYTAPASVAATTTVTVQAVSTIDTANVGTTTVGTRPDPVSGSATITLNPSTHNISGTVVLDGILDPSLTVVSTGTFTFTLTPVSGSPITQTAVLGSGGAFTLSGVPAGTYTLTVQGTRWLKEAIPVDATSTDVSGVSIALPGGDADNNNVIDISDFGILVNAYGSNQGTNVSYDLTADFNCDGTVDIADFGILVNNYGLAGAP